MSLDSTTDSLNTQSRTPLVKRLLLLMLVILVACAAFLFWRYRQYSQRESVLTRFEQMGGSYDTAEFIPEWIGTYDLSSYINPKWFSQIDRLYCSSNEQLEHITLNANLQYVDSLDLRADEESDFDLSLLENMPRLKSLEIDQPEQDLTQELLPLTRFPQLSSLTVRGKPFDKEVARELNRIKTLKAITVECPQLADAELESISLAKNCYILKALDSTITDVGAQHFARMKELRHLSIKSPNLTDQGIKSLRDIPYLQSLELINAQLTDEGFKLLSVNEYLHGIQLENVPISGEGFQHLPRLTHLYLNKMHISSEGLHQINQMPQLQNLSIRNSVINGTVLEQLLRQDSLKYLDLSDSVVSQLNISSISERSKLSSLKLNGISLPAESINHLKQHPSLYSLELCGPWIGNDELRQFADFPDRLRVILSDMKVTEADIEILAAKILNHTVQLQNVQMSAQVRKDYDLLYYKQGGTGGAYYNQERRGRITLNAPE